MLYIYTSILLMNLLVKDACPIYPLFDYTLKFGVLLTWGCRYS